MSEDIDWSKIDENKAKFIHAEAEKALDNILRNSNEIDNKIASLRNACFGLLSAGVILKPFIQLSENLLPLSLLYIGVTIAIVKLLLAYKTIKAPIKGTSPEELLKSKYNAKDLSYLIGSQLQTYTKRIQDGKESNKVKGKAFNFSIWAVVVTLLTAFGIVLGRYWWGSLFCCTCV